MPLLLPPGDAQARYAWNSASDREPTGSQGTELGSDRWVAEMGERERGSGLVRKTPAPCLHIWLIFEGVFSPGVLLCPRPVPLPLTPHSPHFLPGVQFSTQALFSPIRKGLSIPEMASVWGLKMAWVGQGEEHRQGWGEGGLPAGGTVRPAWELGEASLGPAVREHWDEVPQR